MTKNWVLKKLYVTFLRQKHRKDSHVQANQFVHGCFFANLIQMYRKYLYFTIIMLVCVHK